MNFYIGVASKNHIEIGKEKGFCQFCHGKVNPVKRLKKDDWIIYYSPKITFEGNEPYQKFTAIGQVIDDKEYQVEQFKGFFPWRRDIKYFQSVDVDIKPLTSKLSFIKNKTQWGMIFRYGFFKIEKEDFELIKNLMIKDDNFKV